MNEKQGFLGLKKFRERKELRQNQMAKMLSVTSATYNNWETGKRDASFQVYKKLFEMGATVEELFGISYKNDEAELKSSLSDAEAAAVVKQGLKFLCRNEG